MHLCPAAGLCALPTFEHFHAIPPYLRRLVLHHVLLLLPLLLLLLLFKFHHVLSFPVCSVCSHFASRSL